MEIVHILLALLLVFVIVYLFCLCSNGAEGFAVAAKKTTPAAAKKTTAAKTPASKTASKTPASKTASKTPTPATKTAVVSKTTGPDVDCVLSDWDAGNCSQPCGGGEQINIRTVLTPASGGGQACGPLTDSVVCNTQECPVNCDLSSWTHGQCSKTCGGGMQTNTRRILRQPANDGTMCGSLSEESACNTQTCPTDCKLSDWTYSTCSAKCGGGTKTKSRTVTQEAMNGGRPCAAIGPLTSDPEKCNTQPCPIDCDMSSWTQGACSCATKTQTNTRNVLTQAANCGKQCGPTSETVSCSPQNCPVDCAMSQWAPGTCSCATKTQTNTRTITGQPANGGQQCGPTSETVSCTPQNCGPQYAGCYMDDGNRALKHQVGGGNETIATCSAMAKAQGFNTFGLQYGGQCFVDNNPQMTGTYGKVDDSQCNMTCNGDHSTMCGSAYHNSIYRL
jgi:hypothetical protein